jgi:PAS domain S-box-containing protein
MAKRVENQTHNSVMLDAKDIVFSVLRGRQTAASIRTVAEESTRLVAELRARGKKALVLSDVRSLHISDVSAEARIESRRQMSTGTDGTAIVGRRGLMGTVMYLQHITGDKNIRFFTSERKARAWLERSRNPQPPRSSVSIFASVAMVIIGVLALVGWHTGNKYLMSWLPELRPMNPMAAVGLLAIGIGFCSYWYGKFTPLKITGLFGLFLGVAALLPLHVDHLLYAGQLAAAGSHADLGDSAAFCFIAMGLSPFTIGIRRAWWRRPLQYIIALTLIGLGLFNIFGQLYAHDFIYGVSDTFVMAFNLAAAFTIAGITLALLVIYRKMGQNPLGTVNRSGWLLVVALLFVQAATYGGWAQSVDRNRSSASQAFMGQAEDVQAAVDQRLGAYLNSLTGFKGLFAASDFVDQGEFESYYNSLDLAKNYPGVRNVSFIAKVSDKQLPAFIAQRKADKSLHSGGNPAFAVTGPTTLPDHYLVTYVANSTNAGGSDLGAQPSRLQAFERAEASGKAVSSGTIQLAASAAGPAQDGFFLTIPVSSKNAANKVIGFVNVVFSHKGFFDNTFQRQNLLNGLNLLVTDPGDGTTIYAGGPVAHGTDKPLADIANVHVADRQWRLLFSAPQTFGTSASQSSLPRDILVAGQLFAALLLVIFIVLLRSRRQGFELASTITIDLQHERNAAVANDRKTSAILTSIGDAVFAIDTKQRIQLFNPAAERISGFAEKEVLGQPYEDTLHFEFQKTGKVNRHFITTALGGKLATMAGSTVLVCKDGRRIPVADSAAPIRDTDGKILGAIVVFRDISKDYELDKAKTEFVSLASHQLRTPLSAINWYSEMLLNGDAGKLSKQQHEYIVEIFEGNQRMVELVNALLDVSRLEVGKLASTPEPVDLSKLIDDEKKELTVSIKEKSMVFKNVAEAMPPVFADPKQLRMIIQNLLSNAVKYTPAKGSVTTLLRKATAADIAAAHLDSRRPHWFFSITDTGYGIPKAQQPKIFGKLFRADNVRVLDVEGTGLGLYIVKEVVEKMGGRVWFESIESAGTTFYVVAPFPEQDKK